MEDPLDTLIVKADQQPDLKVLAELLQGRVQLVEDGRINFEEDFYTLKQWQMILVYLLARKAAVLKGLLEEKEALSPQSISQQLQLPRKNVTSYLVKELKGLVSSQNGQYNIPNYNLFKCKSKLDKNEK